MLRKSSIRLFVLSSVLLFVISEILAESADDRTDNGDREEVKIGRALQNNFDNDWRVVPQAYDTNDWSVSTERQLQDSDTSTQSQQLKRRRLRKRKRRPQVQQDSNLPSLEAETLVSSPRPRRRRPIPLDQTVDMWKEMESESDNRPHNRRRVGAVMNTENQVSATLQFGDNEVKPHVQQTTQHPTTVQDIKALLKQNDGVSLSEILHQRNLSLADLLKGKQQAILALSERPQQAYEAITENRRTTEMATENPQRNEVDLSQPNVYKVKQPPTTTSKIFNVVTESSTEKRIFVPSSKYYTSIDYNPSTRRTVEMTSSKLPLTSAKLMESTTKRLVTALPSKAYKININDLFGLSTEETPIKNNGPVKILFNIDDMLMKSTTTTTKTTTIKPKPTTVRPQEKLKNISAKEEILEVLKDENSKDNLTKILESRNMTVEELVDQRERGSSQRHLADIFHKKAKEPVPKHEDIIIVETKMVEPTVAPKQEDTIAATSFPAYKFATNKYHPSPSGIPIWKSVYPPPTPLLIPDMLEEETLEEIKHIENTLIKEDQENEIETKRNYSDYDEDFIQLPVGVKSAIFASLAIVGISILVFLTILLIFKWSQRHKERLCYGGSFSCSRIKSPILDTTDPRRSIRTFMCETLGRKRGVYKSHMQSMSDSWDEKPYQ